MAAAYVAPTRREQLSAVLLAALCSILFLGPGLLPGRALLPYPPELEQPMRAEAAAAETSVAELARGNLSMGDKLHQSLAWDRILQDRLTAGEIPRWTRDIAGGASFIPQMAQVYQPWNLMLFLWPSTGVYGAWFLLHQVLLGWLAYRFLRRLGTRHSSAALGMVAVVLGLYVQSRLHQNVIVTAALPLFPMLSSVHAILLCSGGIRAVGWLALATGLSWLGGFPAVSLQMTYLTAAYAACTAAAIPRGERLRPLLYCAAGLGLGGLLSLCQMVPVLVAAADTARPELGSEILAARALEWDYLGTLLWPDLLHWPADHFYVDSGLAVRQPWTTAMLIDPLRASSYPETAFAIGTPALLVALLACGVRGARRQVWFFGSAAILGFLLARAVFPLLQLSALAPGLRASDLKRMVFLIAFCLPVLTAIGADRLSAPTTPRWLLRATLILAAVSGVLACGLWLMAPETFVSCTATLAALGPLTDGTRTLLESGVYDNAADAIRFQLEQAALPGEAAVNQGRLLATFLRAALASGAAWLCLRWLQPSWRAWGLLAVTVLELLHAGRGPVVAVPAERLASPPAVVAPLLTQTADNGVRPRLQRLMKPDDPNPVPLFSPNLGAFFGIEDLAAYNPLPPRRMEELFEAIEPAASGRPRAVLGGAGVSALRRPESLQHPLLGLLGVRYLLTDGPVQAADLVDRTPPGSAEPYHLYERSVLPRATFVARAVVVEDRAARLQRLADPRRDVAAEVILEDPSAPGLPAAPANVATADADVTILAHRDETVRIEVSNGSPGYLRLADPYDPGWTATVDGALHEVYVADHYLRAVYLEPGEHVVEFRFNGSWVVWPGRISLFALLIIAVLCSSGRWRPGGRPAP